MAAALSEVGTQAGLPPAPLHTFREVHSPLARLYNWNLLQPILNAFAVPMDVDDKALVVAGGTRSCQHTSTDDPLKLVLSPCLSCGGH